MVRVAQATAARSPREPAGRGPTSSHRERTIAYACEPESSSRWRVVAASVDRSDAKGRGKAEHRQERAHGAGQPSSRDGLLARDGSRTGSGRRGRRHRLRRRGFPVPREGEHVTSSGTRPQGLPPPPGARRWGPAGSREGARIRCPGEAFSARVTRRGTPRAIAGAPGLLELAEVHARVVKGEEDRRLVEQTGRALVEQGGGLVGERAGSAAPLPHRRSASAQRPSATGSTSSIFVPR